MKANKNNKSPLKVSFSCYMDSTNMMLYRIRLVHAIRNKMKVRYLHKGEYQGPDMTVGKVYLVIGIEADSYRIIDDSQMPYLYDPSQFEIVEYDRPSLWITEYGEDQEGYSYHSSWSSPGFFEDFHDGIQEVVSQFWTDYEALYGSSKSV